MKKMSLLLLTALLVFTQLGLYSTVSAAGFRDVGTSHWAYQDITALTGKKIISGYDNGTYQPNGNVTRAQAAKILYNALGLTEKPSKKLSFRDIKGHWAEDYISVLTEKGIFSDAARFNPNQDLTRSQMAKIIVESFDFTKTSTKKFNDVNPSVWYGGYVSKLYASGVTKGIDEKRFNPNGKVSRAQMAAFVNRAMNKDTLGPPSEPIDWTAPLSVEEIKKLEEELWLEVNKARAKFGLEEYIFSDELSELASERAKLMFEKDAFTHDIPGYGYHSDMMKKDSEFLASMENIHQGNYPPKNIVTGWLNSPTHVKAFYEWADPQTNAGIGIYGSRDGDKLYWVFIVGLGEYVEY